MLFEGHLYCEMAKVSLRGASYEAASCASLSQPPASSPAHRGLGLGVVYVVCVCVCVMFVYIQKSSEGLASTWACVQCRPAWLGERSTGEINPELEFGRRGHHEDVGFENNYRLMGGCQAIVSGGVPLPSPPQWLHLGCLQCDIKTRKQTWVQSTEFI